MTVRVVTDSGCDLPPALCEELGIEVVPLTIRFGSEELVDRVDLDPAGFWKRCAASATLPETSAPSPGAFEEAYRRCAEAGATGVVAINLSGKMSATGQAAKLAAEATTVVPCAQVDSRNASLGEGMIVLSAARAAAEGASLDDVVRIATEAVGKTRLMASLDTLENLRKGGRIGGAQAMLGGLLSIKPMISVEDGEVQQLAKQRTRAKALAALVEKVSELGRIERLGVMHAEAPDLDAFLDRLDPVFPRKDILVGDVGAVIGTHVGPACVGVVAQLP